jgi:hypothetical protein
MSTILRNDRKALWARFQAFDALPTRDSLVRKRSKLVADGSKADRVNLAPSLKRVGSGAADAPAAPNGATGAEIRDNDFVLSRRPNGDRSFSAGGCAGRGARRYRTVGLRLIRVTETSPGYALMRDPKMMCATKSAMAETGVGVLDIELVRITPVIDVAGLEPFLWPGPS